MSLYVLVVLSLCGTILSSSFNVPMPFARLLSGYHVVMVTSGDPEGVIVDEVVSDSDSIALLRLDSYKLHEPVLASLVEYGDEPWIFNGTVAVDNVDYNKFVLDLKEFLNTSHPLYGFVYAGEIPHVFEYLEDLNGIPLEMSARNVICENDTKYEATTRFLEFSDNYAINTTPLDFLKEKYDRMTGLVTKDAKLLGFPLPKALMLYVPPLCDLIPVSVFCLSFTGHSENNTYSLDIGSKLSILGNAISLDLKMQLQEEPLSVMLVDATGQGCAFIFGAEVAKVKLGIEFCLQGMASWKRNSTVSGGIGASLTVHFGIASAGWASHLGLIGDAKGFKGVYGDVIVSTSATFVGVSAGFRLELLNVDYSLHDWYGVGSLELGSFVGIGRFKRTYAKSIKIFKTPSIHLG